MSILFYIAFTALSTVTEVSWEKADKADLKKVLDHAGTAFEAKRLLVNLEYRSYTSHVSKDAYETAKGLYMRADNKLRSDVAGTLTIQDGKHKVSINNEQRIVMFDIIKTQQQKVTDEFVQLMWEQVTEVKKRKQSATTEYSVLLKGNSRVEEYRFLFDDQNRMKQIVMLFRHAAPLDPSKPNGEKSKPRLEISFSGYETNFTPSANDFNISTVVSVTKDRADLTQTYKDFQLYDLRIR